jgi:hypothetical protein
MERLMTPKELTERLANAMTPKTFKTRMANLFYSSINDPEYYHGKMDELMCELLRSLGYGDGIDIFESAEKWYA